MTLRDIWMSKGWNSAKAAVEIDCSVNTLYKLNRKSKGYEEVGWGIVRRVCKVLEISYDMFDALEACPKAERYK